ncbi:vegetative cell wall protein gp1-like [Peromyscus leucopus]|uniref:vegetative cell wall protein gp1-like n=1 Tax=Peromyscus leucopus TaxID=10041 RepID=UPI0010A151D3|nr:vegetative cell wall protein gp1-like [Peromyscus leucopus]
MGSKPPSKVVVASGSHLRVTFDPQGEEGARLRARRPSRPDAVPGGHPFTCPFRGRPPARERTLSPSLRRAGCPRAAAWPEGAALPAPRSRARPPSRPGARPSPWARRPPGTRGPAPFPVGARFPPAASRLGGTPERRASTPLLPAAPEENLSCPGGQPWESCPAVWGLAPPRAPRGAPPRPSDLVSPGSGRLPRPPRRLAARVPPSRPLRAQASPACPPLPPCTSLTSGVGVGGASLPLLGGLRLGSRLTGCPRGVWN